VTAYCSRDALAGRAALRMAGAGGRRGWRRQRRGGGRLFDARHDRSDGQVSATRLNVVRVAA